MVIHTQKETLVQALSSVAKSDKIGFVPTMGALHEGHISLVKNALEDNDVVVVSIFVNPTQFNNSADLEKYPRTPDDDILLLKKLKGNVIGYLPEVSDLYDASVYAKKYNFGNLENEMEGKHRKGHFDGVGTIVSKLLKIVKPNTAYFGEKDFQQLQIVKKLVDIEKIPVKIVGCPILREKNGLAMSSRNKRLTAKQFEEAALIYKTLQEVREKFSSKSINELNALVAERFLRNPHLKLEYFEIANEKTLKTAKRKNKDTKYRAFIAAFADEVRLIDNIPLN
ncbi:MULTISPECIES: pantoate--beta-alanine ligase [Aequorivita]|uniref:Pantothenate synthetase n=1 Tax=Aequorivita iocasae TaxID=2803865 RepID=A0ABX7DTS0_9FLAO|nr:MULTISPECIES: pantoate--beta-alanine ligase [Aequorivita]QQX77388.1 pantoate--beta-alanine ligase [Aequorivita iocasae]UCA56877.1 pantoate--beta-alanine ligase [Aequorivita sp. F7]